MTNIYNFGYFWSVITQGGWEKDNYFENCYRSEEMTYEKMSRAMRYHYGSEKHGRKGHLAMVKEKRLYYRFEHLLYD